MTSEYIERLELPELVRCLALTGEAHGFGPICFRRYGEGQLFIDHDGVDQRLILRVEVYVEAGEQYVYVQRDEGGLYWTQPRLGEWPGREVYGLTEIHSKLNNPNRAEVHPLLRVL